MSFIIGQAPPGPCPVCGVSPLALREIDGFPEFAECARCALTYVVRTPEGDRLQVARCPLSPGFIEVFRLYWRETRRPLGLPLYLIEDFDQLDPIRQGRVRELDEWLGARPHLVAGAAAPQTWPYAGLTVVLVELEGRPIWRVIAPPAGLALEPMIPFSPEGIPVGTIMTLLIPMGRGERPTAQEPEAEH